MAARPFGPRADIRSADTYAQAVEETHRYRTWATRHVAPLLPVLGDWKGTGAPVLTLFSRNG